MHLYIAHRNLKEHFEQNNGFGGVPYNNDYRFTSIKDGIYYLLTQNGVNWAVSKEDGEKFIEDVLSKCTGEHRGIFPFVPSLNGKETAAVIEISREVDNGRRKMTEYLYHDMDDEVLFQMLEELKAKCGEPLDKAALMNYCYPNPQLPEGDFDLVTIYHGIYCKPDNRPNSVIQTIFPDKMISHFWMNKNGAFIQMRVDDNEVTSKVPSELIPEIKEKVRQLCKNPKDAYVEHGDWEGYIRFGEEEERIFTDPDKTLELLKEIASKSEFDSSEAVDTRKYYKVNKLPDGIGMSGFMAMAGLSGALPAVPAEAPSASSAAQSIPSNSKKCVYCGADVTGKKFCTECGGKVDF